MGFINFETEAAGLGISVDKLKALAPADGTAPPPPLALPAATVADVTAPDATDPQTTEDLANANKAAINALLASLRASNLLAT